MCGRVGVGGELHTLPGFSPFSGAGFSPSFPFPLSPSFRELFFLWELFFELFLWRFFSELLRSDPFFRSPPGDAAEPRLRVRLLGLFRDEPSRDDDPRSSRQLPPRGLSFPPVQRPGLRRRDICNRL